MFSLFKATIAAFAGLLAIASVTGTAVAANDKAGSIEIVHPWVRATPPAAPTGGGYLTLINKGTTPDRLTAARSPQANLVRIHEMKMDGNVMRMREVEKGVELPAGSTVTLKPGDIHLMMMGLKGPLVAGTKVPITLVFEKAGSVDVEFPVEALGGPSRQGH